MAAPRIQMTLLNIMASSSTSCLGRCARGVPACHSRCRISFATKIKLHRHHLQDVSLGLQQRGVIWQPCLTDLVCRSFEPDKNSEPSDPLAPPQRVQSTLTKAPTGPLAKVNSAYLSITGAMLALMLFKNPYIYAALTVATVIPQNSNVTSLNTLVVWFYESGLFMNFAEAVNAVRLVTWLSISLCIISFALFT